MAMRETRFGVLVQAQLNTSLVSGTTSRYSPDTSFAVPLAEVNAMRYAHPQVKFGRSNRAGLA